MIVVSIQVILSMGLAITFFASAIPKLLYPKSFILAVLEYRVLPTRLSWLYARLLPPLELLLALLLLSGTAVRSSAIVVALLLLSFMTAVSINLVRGRDLDCHCFGKTHRRSIGWGLLLQDGALLSAAIALAVITGTWIAPVPWSVFRLSGLVQAGSPVLLLGCAAVTVCAAMFLSRSTFGKGRF
jgi:putative oxidoreductase